MSNEMQRVGVLGCGLMGAGIAEVCVRANLDVVVVEANPAAAERGLKNVTTSMERAAASGKISDDELRSALSRLAVTDDWTQLADRQLVVEAVSENPDLKVSAFERLDEVVRSPDAILATNTSSIPIMRLATATGRPEQVVGLHFFNPVPRLPLVELVPSLMTSQSTLERVRHFASDVLHKNVIESKDRAGFIVNALLIPYLLSAIRMFEAGFATADDIDTGMINGCAHPMGPLALTDLIGLDTTMAVAESMYAEFKEPLYAPPALLSRMVEAGLLGRKTGRGFYDYSKR